MEMETKSCETEYYIEEGALVVDLTKELDHHNAVAIREKVDEYIIRKGIEYVIFDFSKTCFMDSSGIGVVMGRQRIMESIGGRVYVRNMNREIQRIFLISGLHKMVDVLDTQAE
jgi:stage II sporulation protein AA (anti-sigma F factor antagonist)